VLSIVLFCLSCGLQSAGNTSETGNARIAGIIYEPDGVTPADGATVTARVKSVLPPVSPAAAAKRMAEELTTVTDESGTYAFDSLETGRVYVIETARDGNVAIVDSVVVMQAGLPVQCSAVTLKPAGSLRGTVAFGDGTGSDAVVICALGLNKFVTIESDGSFQFDGLPEGMLSFSVVDGNALYTRPDNLEVVVRSGEVVDIGELHLEPMTVPVPQNLTAEFDSCTGNVVLMWDGYSAFCQLFRSEACPQAI